ANRSPMIFRGSKRLGTGTSKTRSQSPFFWSLLATVVGQARPLVPRRIVSQPSTKGAFVMRLVRNRFATGLFGLGLLLVAPSVARAQITIDFEDLYLDPESYYNGSDGAGGFTSYGAFFNNSYNSMFKSWKGWSYSNVTDVTTPGYQNQYSAYNLPDGGGDGA